MWLVRQSLTSGDPGVHYIQGFMRSAVPNASLFGTGAADIAAAILPATGLLVFLAVTPRVAPINQRLKFVLKSISALLENVLRMVWPYQSPRLPLQYRQQVPPDLFLLQPVEPLGLSA